MFQASTLNNLTAVQKAEFVAALPKKRLIEPDEIALICEFLTQDHATVLHGAVINASLGLGTSPWLIRK